MDVERVDAVEPAKSMFLQKAQIRQLIRNHGIPHTFVCNNCLHAFFIPRLGQADISPPIFDKVNITGDGDSKGKSIYAYLVK